MHFVIHIVMWYVHSVCEGNFLITLRSILLGALIGMTVGFVMSYIKPEIELRAWCMGFGTLGAVVAAPFGAGIRVGPRRGWKPVGDRRPRSKTP